MSMVLDVEGQAVEAKGHTGRLVSRLNGSDRTGLVAEWDTAQPRSVEYARRMFDSMTRNYGAQAIERTAETRREGSDGTITREFNEQADEMEIAVFARAGG